MKTAIPKSAESTFAYVNRERTHEVLALAELHLGSLRWSVTERPAGSKDPKDWLVNERSEDPSRLPELVRELEARLAATGTYYRLAADGSVAEPLGTPPALDLRSHAVRIPGAKEGTFLEYFHFHGARESRVLMALPRAALGATGAGEADDARFVLASFDFPTGAPRHGKLNVAHARLAPEMVVSHVAGQHLALPKRGLRKLYEEREYREALGDDWRTKELALLTTAATTLLSGRTRPPPEPEATPPPATPEPEFVRALASDAYAWCRANLLGEGGADAALALGELEVRRAIREKRRRATHDDQPRLSLLEAGLLVEHGLRTGRPTLVLENAAQLVRMSRAIRPP